MEDKKSEKVAKSSRSLQRIVKSKEMLNSLHEISSSNEQFRGNALLWCLIFLGLIATNFKKSKTFLSILLLTSIVELSVVKATEDFEMRYGGSLSDTAQAILPTADNGYFVTGYSSSKGVTVQAVWALKINNVGTVIWEQTFTATCNSFIYSMAKTVSGGIVMSGQRCVNGDVSNYRTYVVQLSPNGQTDWFKDFTEANGQYGRSIIVLLDSNYLISGETALSTAGQTDGFSMKISNTGTLVWYKSYGTASKEAIYRAKETSDGNLIFSGEIDTGGGYRNCWFIKASNTGVQSVNLNYGGPDDDYCRDIVVLADGNYGLIGSTKSAGSGGFDAALWIVSSAGVLSSTKYFGGANDDFGMRLKYTSDAKLYVGGSTASKGAGNNDVWLFRLTSTYTIEWEGTFGGANTDSLNDFSFNSDNSMAVAGESNTASAGGLDYYVTVVVLNCPAGRYLSSTTNRCIKCSAGTYNPTEGATLATACVQCPIGTYQSSEGMTNCIQCPSGTYRATLGGNSLSSCLACTGDYATSIDQSSCLYKGIFTNVAAYQAHTMSITCYSNLQIVKPFLPACRTSYRSACCTGSTKLTTVNCNFGLGLQSNEGLFNNYCSACPFVTQTSCPTEGLCWSNTAFTSNTIDPYTAISSAACLTAVGPYCSPKLARNPIDPECYLFGSYCGATVKSSTYGISTTKFTITFTLPISTTNPNCTTLFNSPTIQSLNGSLTCTMPDTKTLTVDISAASPVTRFSFNTDALKDSCFYTLPADTFVVTPPTLYDENIQIFGGTTDKCLGMLVNSTVKKPYAWPVKKITWSLTYSNMSSIPDNVKSRLPSIYGSLENASSILVQEIDLIPGQVIIIQATMLTAFNATINSPLLQFKVPEMRGGRKYCGPCQFDDRSLCTQYNDICWSSYMNYSIQSPNATGECLKKVLKECNKIWSYTTTGDPQCFGFVPYIDWVSLKIKPKIRSVAYSSAKTSVIINFDQAINNMAITDPALILEQETISWLPPLRTAKWLNKIQFEFDYDPAKGIMREIKVKPNTLFFDYAFAQDAVEGGSYKIDLPPFNPELSIRRPSNPNECENFEMAAIITKQTFYPMVFRWDINLYTYADYVSEAYKTEIKEYTAKFNKYSTQSVVVIPSKYLFNGSELSVTLYAKPANIEGNEISSSFLTTIGLFGVTARFMTRTQNILMLDGSQINVLPIQISARNCSKDKSNSSRYFEGTPPDAKATVTTFQIYSGTSPTAITTRGKPEMEIEDALKGLFGAQLVVTISTSRGFDYGKYYNIIMTINDTNTGATSTDSQIIYMTKPAIKSVIDVSAFVSTQTDAVLGGKYSEFPDSAQDELSFEWKCISATSFLSVYSSCVCPVMADAILNSQVLIISKDKLAHLCKYVFSLTISAKTSDLTRKAYNEAEFIAYSGSVVPIRHAVSKGNDNRVSDLYFTAVLPDAFNSSNVSYNWTLVEVKEMYPDKVHFYSKKNTFISWFLSAKGINFNAAIANGDTEIPDLHYPISLTPNDGRTFGINLKSLRPFYKYTYAVAATFPNTTVDASSNTSFTLVQIDGPQSVSPRQVSVTPSEGIGFVTEFSIAFTPILSTVTDWSKYQIFRRDCSGYEAVPITKVLGNANVFRTVLSQGRPSCNYKVDIILRSIENDDYQESSSTVIIKPPSDSKEKVLMYEILTIQSIRPDISLDNRITLANEMANVEVTEVSNLTGNIADAIIALCIQPETIFGNILYTIMGKKERLIMINTTMTCLRKALINQRANINPNMLQTVKARIGDYLNVANSDSGSGIIISTYLLLLDEIIKFSRDNNSLSFIQNSLDQIRDIKLRESLYGGMPFVVSTSISELMIAKSSLDKLNVEQTYTTNKGISLKLPSNMKDIIIGNLTNGSKASSSRLLAGNSSSVSTDYSLGIVMQTLHYNPFAPVRNNTKVNSTFIRSIGSSIMPEKIAEIYNDLANGRYAYGASKREQNTDIVKLSFTLSQILENATEIATNAVVPLNNLGNSTIEISWPTIYNISSMINTSIMQSLYYIEENKTWINDGSNLVPPSINDLSVKAVYGASCFASKPSGIYAVIDIIRDIAGLDESESGLSASAPVIAVLIAFGAVLIILGALVYIRDASRIFNESVAVLEERFGGSQIVPLQTGKFSLIYELLLQVQQQGIVKTAQINQQQVIPGPTNVVLYDTNIESLPKEDQIASNGFTKLNNAEEQNLKYLQMDLAESKQWFNPGELRQQMYSDIVDDVVLKRLTQARLETEITRKRIGFFTVLKVEHPISNIISIVDPKTPSAIKFLILASALMGELFIIAWFATTFTSSLYTRDGGSFGGDVVGYSIISAAIMIALKIVLILLMSGFSLHSKMTRAQIESKEYVLLISRRIGLIFVCIWNAGCIIGIIIFSVDFTSVVMEKWLIMFAVAVIWELLIFVALKILFKLCFGLILMTISKGSCILSPSVFIVAKLIDRIALLI